MCALNYMLQAIRLKYLHPDSELQNFALQVMEMLRVDTSADAQALVFFFVKQILTSTLYLFLISFMRW